jgi:hypothetical protein
LYVPRATASRFPLTESDFDKVVTMKDFHSGRAAAPERPARRKAVFAAVLGFALCQLPLAHAAETRLPEGLTAKAAAMPAFALPTTAGSKLDSRSLAGQVVVIRFWASW